ncbi:MAG: PSD1 and planctomycete cytochrome C domain-containing protein [Verrucomicrobiales bacterium]
MRSSIRLLLCFFVSPPAMLVRSSAGETLDFNRDVQPILAGHCLECHGPDSAARKGELRLDRGDGLADDRGGYRILVPGKPDSSELIARITHADPEERMPPADFGKKEPLKPEEIEILKRWITEGGAFAEHWAFIPPQRPPLPKVSDENWPRNDIDRFVLSRLDEEGLRPAPEADRTTLIRRAALALTGLPPTIDEIDAFLADGSADAFEKVVDRLLASPRYGLHMALPWLDAARYSDSSGYQADWERYQWPWRDWVVDAYNANMPFDHFTVEQLAGDMLPEATLAQKIATGFNRNHRINDEGGSLDAEFEVEYVVDRVDTTASVWLGLSAGCARCHDHKYDPLSQKEFYGLYAYFNNVPEKGIDGRKGAANPFVEIPNERAVAELEERKAQLAELQKAGEAGDAKARIEKLKKEIKWLERHRKGMAMVMQELPDRRPTYLLKRGDYQHPDKSEVIPPALPAVFEPAGNGAEFPRDRLGLARWIACAENPLTARVTVNRLWQHHFGTGIVRTAEDFGTRGDRPSHPGLLDWLATEFVRRGWDLKAMHRLIVTSATFRQASKFETTAASKDPMNRLLARGPRLRLSGAAIRDQALLVAGLLSERQGGQAVKPYQPAGLWEELSFGNGKTTIDFYEQDHGENLYRRSLYTFWKRTVAPPQLAIFDGGGREACRVRGDTTNTPMQALNLQNDVTFVEAARHLAQRMMREGGPTDAERLTFAWRLVLGRKPDSPELEVLVNAAARHREKYAHEKEEALKLLSNGESARDESLPPHEHAALTVVALTILNLDQAITLE